MSARQRRGRSARKSAREVIDVEMLPTLRNALAPIEPLSQEQVEKIDDASMAILEEVGVVFRDQIALQHWREVGADVDGELVRFDRALVRELVSTIPSGITWWARDIKKSVDVGGSSMIFVPMTGAPYL